MGQYWDSASQTLREAFKLSEADAAARKHGFIGTEHLLAALLKMPRSAAVLALRRSGREVSELATELEKLIPPGPINTMGTISGDYRRLPQTPRAKLAITRAFELAAESDHEPTTTAHLLFGLLQLPPEELPPSISRLALDANEIRAMLEDVSEL